MNTPTPRTDDAINWHKGVKYVEVSFTRKLERELTAVTEQRDRLAEALKEYREALHDGPENCSYKMYEAVDEFAREALQPLNQNACLSHGDASATPTPEKL